MKLIKINYNNEDNNINYNKYLEKIKYVLNNNVIALLLILNILLNIYLIISNKKKAKLIKGILDLNNTFYYKNNINVSKNDFPNNDKEMIGLYYPEINFINLQYQHLFV